ncbi:MAG: hypothetical protein OEV89_07285 [Desulfobulbaceae bacterium]|nr:hypothetical protein [Desulfobulbaceae bacterium]HIJ90555.1 hypothetical protein [Deltaproteobacteria bacterium]
MTDNGWLSKLLMITGKSLPVIQAQVQEMKREYELAQGGKPERYVNYGVSSKLIKRASMKTAAFGGLVSVPATIPGVGLIGTLLAGITADLVYLVRTQIELCYAISIVYGVQMDEDELKAVSLALLGFSGSAEAAKGIAVRTLRGAVDEITVAYLRRGIPDSAMDVSAKLVPRFAGKAYRLIPFLGIPISASLNIASTMMVGNQARKYFSTWEDCPELLSATGCLSEIVT